MADVPTNTVVVTTTRASEGGDSLPDRSRMVTRGALPDVIIQVVSPLVAIAVRGGRSYVQSLITFLAASQSGIGPEALTSHDFGHRLAICASLAVAPAVGSVLANTAMLLAKWDQKFPTMQA